MKKDYKKQQQIKLASQLLRMFQNKKLSKNSNLYRKLNGDPPKKKTKKTATEGQLRGRLKFAIAGRIANLCRAFLIISHDFDAYKEKSKAQGQFYKLVYHHLIVGDYPDFSVNYPQLKLSNGHDSRIEELQYTITENGLLNLSWEDQQQDIYNYNAFSTVYIFVINETQQKSELIWEVPYPRDYKLQQELQNYTKGDQLHCWMMLKWRYHRKVSDCRYAFKENVIDLLNP